MVRIKAKKTQDPVDSIGEKLRKVRQDKDISLEEAYGATKIHPNVLEALEEDRLENILGKAYVKAFLGNYARYLGLDAKTIIAEYSSKHTPEAEIYKTPILGQKPISRGKNKKFIRAIIFTLAFITWLSILSFATVKFIHQYKYAIKSKKVTTVVRSSELKEPDVKKGLIAIPKSRTITLTILASKDVWLKLIQDGELAFHGTLSRNSKETWRANKEIRLSEIGRPEALKLNVNGEDIDFSERRLGKNILITPEGINLE